ncbi:MAG: glycerol-3-phosphate acyltransferase [Actinobacteria bacterium]|nr:glycerol-3-phosphate acyltransferase [Actinomycetota bacterium]
MSRKKRGARSRSHTALALGAAFALGSLPSARLVGRAFGVDIDRVGTGNPGTANVRRSLGFGPAALVLAMDAAKGFVPVVLGRRSGASPGILGALGFAPVAAHVFVVRGKGAATALGTAMAGDPVGLVIVGSGIVSGTLVKLHAPAVLAGYVTYPVVRLLLGRSRVAVAWTAAQMALVIEPRLRGPGAWSGLVSGRVVWERLMFDREPS